MWVTNAPMARALAATMPSGDRIVVCLRRRLQTLLRDERCGDPPAFSMASSVSRVESMERPWPSDAVYVGHGPAESGLNASPWGSPFISSSSSECARSELFVNYARSRADLCEWLAPLLNKRLLCHCSGQCHAHDLAALIEETFKRPNVLQTAPSVASVRDTCEVGYGVIPFGTDPVDFIDYGDGLKKYVLQQPSVL